MNEPRSCRGCGLCRWTGVVIDGIKLEVTEMSDYDVLNADTGGVKSEDQGNYLGEGIRAEVWDKRDAGEGIINNRRGETKERGHFGCLRMESLIFGADAVEGEDLSIGNGIFARGRVGD